MAAKRRSGLLQRDLYKEQMPISVHKLLSKNQKFEENKKFAKIRHKLKSGQHPDVVMVCCSDSRVPPEIIFNLANTLGVMFVVRNAGCVVDEVAMESIMYALEHCNTRLVVVMGHQECGAVNAAYTAHCNARLGVQNKAGYPAIVGRIRRFFEKKNPRNLNSAVKLNTVGIAECISRHLLQEGRLDVGVVSVMYDFNGKVKRISRRRLQ